MKECDRYSWLKMPIDFFQKREVQFLMNMPEGHTLVLIYLKITLFGVKDEGIYRYLGIFETIEEELACSISEDKDNVVQVVNLLIKSGAMERWDDGTLYLLGLQKLIGSETLAAERMRKHRKEREDSQKPETRNTDVTPTNSGITKEVQESNNFEQCYTDKEKDNKELEKIKQIVDAFNGTCISLRRADKNPLEYADMIKETIERGIPPGDILKGFSKSEASNYLKGENSNKFLATFGWVIRYENMIRILSGQFDNPKQIRKKRI